MILESSLEQRYVDIIDRKNGTKVKAVFTVL